MKNNQNYRIGDEIFVFNSHTMEITKLKITNINVNENEIRIKTVDYELRNRLKKENPFRKLKFGEVISTIFNVTGKPNASFLTIHVDGKNLIVLDTMERAEDHRKTYVIEMISKKAREWNDTLNKYGHFLPKEFDYLKPIAGSKHENV